MADLNPFYRGDTRKYDLSFVDGDGVAIPITGWTIFFTMKEREGDADDDATISKTITSHSAPESGETTFTLTAEETILFKAMTYHYDIQAKKADGTIVTVTKGKVQVLVDITRRVA